MLQQLGAQVDQELEAVGKVVSCVTGARVGRSRPPQLDHRAGRGAILGC